MKKLIFSLVFVFSGLFCYAQHSLDTLSYVKHNPNVYAIIYTKDGKLVYENYFNKFNDKSLFNDQSLTKSIVSLLIGIAIDKGYIKSVDEKVSDFFPELKSDADKRKQEITIRQIMNQASGLYHENLEDLDAYLEIKDPSAYVLKAPLVSDPGKLWHYNNAATHLLSVILTKSTGMDTHQFAKKVLFDPLGIVEFEWSKMRDGYDDGCGLLSIHLRAADLVKIGTLILNEGHYSNMQIVSEKWIKLILQPDIFYPADWGFFHSTYALCYYHTIYNGTEFTYGMGWGGQFLIMIPSLKAVVVINENIADATAVKQSITFTNHIFPVILDQLKHD